MEEQKKMIGDSESTTKGDKSQKNIAKSNSNLILDINNCEDNASSQKLVLNKVPP